MSEAKIALAKWQLSVTAGLVYASNYDPPQFLVNAVIVHVETLSFSDGDQNSVRH
jgi:hypothetical protein